MPVREAINRMLAPQSRERADFCLSPVLESLSGIILMIKILCASRFDGIWIRDFARVKLRCDAEKAQGVWSFRTDRVS